LHARRTVTVGRTLREASAGAGVAVERRADGRRARHAAPGAVADADAGDRGGSPAATKLQVPGADVVPHDLHVSVQALLQQSPSTQNPLAQSPAQPHAVPLARLLPPSRPQATASAPPSFFPAGGGEDE